MPKGTQRECLFSGVIFRPDPAEEQLCPQAKQAIQDSVLNAVKVDESFRRELITAMLADSNVSIHVAMSLFSVKAEAIGIQTSGSIADLFCKQVKRHSDTETQKDSRTVGRKDKKKSKQLSSSR